MKSHKPFAFKCEEIRYYYNEDLIWYSEFWKAVTLPKGHHRVRLERQLLPQHSPLVPERKWRSTLFHKACRSRTVGALPCLPEAPVCAFSWN